MPDNAEFWSPVQHGALGRRPFLDNVYAIRDRIGNSPDICLYCIYVISYTQECNWRRHSPRCGCQNDCWSDN